jgi:glutamate/tyrosine decarboxylase-like PLP-dependent enzyme
MIVSADLNNTTQVVDYMLHRFMRVPPSDNTRRKLVAFLDKELGTPDIAVARTYMEEPLRLLLHLIMSQPEYQLS